jgi:PHD/YefM family antitoxin component YafN of YafNO toxin-antitoxin module
MRKVSNEECGSRLKQIVKSLAEDGPVAIQRDGEDVAIVLTPELFLCTN